MDKINDIIPPENTETPAPQVSDNANCSLCGDKMRGHEDESATNCRWCVTGWTQCNDEDDTQDCG